MNETAYILVVLSLVILFLYNKREKVKLQILLQQELLKSDHFRQELQGKMTTSENQNDLIAYVNKNYRLGILYSKELVETIAGEQANQ
ncbi:hypothetical protein D8796_00760 [Streptococcus cristatus]|uniref:MarR family transcriptional regulator n=1 Tax=Streptococcus cristatus TaxID=45634 RepID=A0A428GX92_STRCR|nr:MarR family transcriptional regulator [Streptococcus cristatus]RSJ80860.1 hypothetical protein D8795_02660 [Streptococcus cristatus]RSJ82260.1 hypothetical protein D8796_00760 [Streptococcus cristatus]RSJ87607.1 hypothetical protein D8793_01605 [Streptococcus cristatus]RSJ88073.1 hypothetical protein D8794_01605 [Streptococcus cristatus]